MAPTADDDDELWYFLLLTDMKEGEEICINYVAFIHGTYLRREKLEACRTSSIGVRQKSSNQCAKQYKRIAFCRAFKLVLW